MRVISESVASLPLHLFSRLATGGKQRAPEHPLYRLLHRAPNPWQTSMEFREQLTALYLMYGQSFALIRAGAGGFADQLWPLHPSRMRVEVLENEKANVPVCDSDPECKWSCEVAKEGAKDPAKEREAKDIKTVGDFVRFCIEPAMKERKPEPPKKDEKK